MYVPPRFHWLGRGSQRPNRVSNNCCLPNPPSVPCVVVREREVGGDLLNVMYISVVISSAPYGAGTEHVGF